MIDENAIGVVAAAKILGVTVPTIHHHITHGNLPTVGRFGNALILDRRTVEAFKREREARR